ncbi:MAG: DUF2239 family protein [Oligoflexia bacterium]|nr:DUF2239 family protein [Oligoflexia bacterium]
MKQRKYTVFEDKTIIAKGNLEDVVMIVKKRIGSNNHTSAIIFDDRTGRTIDIDFSGTLKDVQERLAIYITKDIQLKTANGPGRPKLGVISREISLLPEHWEWLAIQPGGASVALRKLVTSAKKEDLNNTNVRYYQDAIAQFLNVVGGDLPNYEEAIRALYRKEKEGFFSQITKWPKDIKAHLKDMATSVFELKK